MTASITPLDNFMTFVDQRLERSGKFRDFFTLPSKGLPPLAALAAEKVISGVQDISTYPIPLQEQLLNTSKTFTYWRNARTICAEDVIAYNNEQLKGRLSKHSGQTEADIYVHLFNETFAGCDTATLESLIALKRRAAPLSETRGKLRDVIEKVIPVASWLLSHPAVQIAGGLIMAYYTWGGTWKVLGLANTHFIKHSLPLIINHVPVNLLNVATKVYDCRFRIWFAAFGLSQLTGSPALNKWVFRPLTLIVLCTTPLGLGYLVLKISVQAFALYVKHSASAGRKLNALNARWIDFRFGKELREARRLWVQTNLDRRAAFRADVAQQLAQLPCIK